MLRLKPAILAAGSIVLMPLALSAQDSHYWNHQYGARSTLLSGAVIAGVDDASATFYNPGALAGARDGELLEGTRIFEFTDITIHTELDETLSLDSDDFGRAPSFLGGIVPTGWRRHVLSYALFKRQAFDLRDNIAVSGERDVINRNPGAEAVFASNKIDNKLSEQWVGLGWAYEVSPTIGVGVSTFVARRSQRGLSDASGQAVLNDGQVVTSRYSEYYKYSHYRFVWKAGILLSSERSRVGLTLTSPSLSLRGTGEREIIDAYAGLDVDRDGTADQLLSADYQDNVGANFKAPISVGLGYSLTLDGRTIHVSAEWYGEIPEYNVVHVQEAVSQTTGAPIDNQLSGFSGSVLNFAFGVEQDVTKRIRGFASFATDFSSMDEADPTDLSLARWDLFHLTAGTRFHYRKADLTLGVGYVFGDETSDRDVSLIDISETNRLFGRTASTQFRYQRIQLIVGLSVSG